MGQVCESVSQECVCARYHLFFLWIRRASQHQDSVNERPAVYMGFSPPYLSNQCIYNVKYSVYRCPNTHIFRLGSSVLGSHFRLLDGGQISSSNGQLGSSTKKEKKRKMNIKLIKTKGENKQPIKI